VALVGAAPTRAAPPHTAAWKQAEFNIIGDGDGGGSKATFNAGSSIWAAAVRSAVPASSGLFAGPPPIGLPAPVRGRRQHHRRGHVGEGTRGRQRTPDVVPAP